jgi:hypothetical protein
MFSDVGVFEPFAEIATLISVSGRFENPGTFYGKGN